MEANLTAADASAIQQAKIKNDLAFAVARKSMDTQRQQGEATVELVKQVASLTAQLDRGGLDVSL